MLEVLGQTPKDPAAGGSGFSWSAEAGLLSRGESGPGC